MTDKPNNFQREGLHGTVTRDGVKRLEAERPTLNVERHYTIGGAVETLVHSNANAEREAAITIGSRRLQQASSQLRQNFEAPQDTARADYIRQQKATVMRREFQSRAPIKTPSR